MDGAEKASESPAPFPRNLRLGILGLVVLYGVSTWVALSLGFEAPLESSFWIPSGFGLTAILLRKGLWPGVWVGSSLSALPLFLHQGPQVGATLTLLAVIAAGGGKVLEAFVGATLVEGVLGRGPVNPLHRLNCAVIFVAIAAIAALIGATTALGSVLLVPGLMGTLIDQAQSGLPFLFATWFHGSWLGMLILPPLVLPLVHPQDSAGVRPILSLEGVVMLTLLTMASLVAFGGLAAVGIEDYPLAFLPVPFLVWAAFRFSQPSALVALLLAVLVTVWGTAQGLGPFGMRPAATEQVLLLELYHLTITVTILALVSSLNEGRRASRQLEAEKERAEQADQTKAEFIDMASHELKTPLTTMRLLVERMLRQTEAGRASDPSLIQRMERQILRLTEMLNDLLNLSQIERGTLPLRLAPLDLREVARDAIRDQTEQSPDREFLMDEPERPCVVLGDRTRLEQVLVNFMDNARKYSPVGSPIEVRISAAGDTVTLAVTDHGKGISKQEQAKLFTRFYRIQREYTGRQPGLGLGLYISRRIIEHHHGAIGVESVPGEGSTFSFTLPLAAPNS